MDFYESGSNSELDFGNTPSTFFLVGALSEFNNRYQAKADSFFKEISWKQYFAIICINLYKDPPSLKELARTMGSSHQNVKQILMKLEQKGFVSMQVDEKDKRIQRFYLTEKTLEFSKNNHVESEIIISQIFKDIDPQKIEITIQTIMQMSQNLKGVEVDENNRGLSK